MIKYKRATHCSVLCGLSYYFIQHILMIFFPSPTSFRPFPLSYAPTFMSFLSLKKQRKAKQANKNKATRKAMEADLPDGSYYTDGAQSVLFPLEVHSLSTVDLSLLMMSPLLSSDLMPQSILCINNFLASKFLSLCLI